MSNQKKIKIVLTGGGTAGHTMPLIAVAREMRKIAKNQNILLSFVFIGPARGSNQISDEKYIKRKILISGRFRRYFSFHNFIEPLKLLTGFVQAFFYLLWYRPNIIFSKGGYGSFPTTVVAWLFKIPIISHESDSIAGATNKFLAKFSKKIIVSFPVVHPKLPHNKTVLLGQPVRDLRGANIENAKKEFNIKTNKPILLIRGGSQGALQINNLILDILKELVTKYEVLHQTGEKNYNTVIKKVEKLFKQGKNPNYHAYPFFNEQEMRYAYKITKLIVDRSGAGVFEIALAGKPSILIPLATSAAKHQQKNAEIYSASGAAIVLNPHTVTSNELLKTINSLMNDEQKLNQMSVSALKFAKPNAANDIAKLILEYATKNN